MTWGSTVTTSSSTVLYCAVLYCTVLYCTVLYCTAGGYDDLGQYRDDILEYSPATETWTPVASMTAPRGFHAVSSFSEEQGEDLQIYCDQ